MLTCNNYDLFRGRDGNCKNVSNAKIDNDYCYFNIFKDESWMGWLCLIDNGVI